MKLRTYQYAVISTLMLFFLFIGNTHGQTSAIKKQKTDATAKIAILGTFHFGSTGDVAAVKVKNIKGEIRQGEIKELLEHLKDYKPTKVLVEVVTDKKQKLNRNYSQYIAGEFDLPKSEVYQLGFRMASMMNHESVYAIDYMLQQPFGEVEEFAKKHGMGNRFKNFVENVRKKAKRKSEYIANHKLIDYYKQLNADTSDRWNRSLYLQETLDYNQDTIYTGPKIAAMHYKRNLYITANVMRHANPGERLLLIIGSGHRAVMKHFFNTRQDIDYVEVNQFLK